MKIQKKNWGGWWAGWVGGGGVRLDVNEELMFICENSKKKNLGGGGRSCWGGGGVVWKGGCERRIEVFEKIHKTKFWERVGVRVDVNAMLGVGGDVGYGRCEPRIEDIVQCQRYCTILK